MKVNWSKAFTDDELRKLAAKLKPSKRANNRLAKRAEVRGWLDTLVKDAISVMDAPRQRVPFGSPEAVKIVAAALANVAEPECSCVPYQTNSPTCPLHGDGVRKSKERKKAGWKCGCGRWTTEPMAKRCAECRKTPAAPTLDV